MAEVDLLRRLPRPRRDLKAREAAKTEEHIQISSEYGEMYFDGPREFGYGGYRYDGRWVSVARDIVDHFRLRPGDRVLDVGCAKGFLVKDLLQVCPGLEVYGVDVSFYALTRSEPEARGRLVRGSAEFLPFAGRNFSAVLAINTIHNLPREACAAAVREIERLAPGKGFIQVDSFRTPRQKELFESWVLTARFYDYPEGWVRLFEEAGYTGDYFWTIIE